MKNFYRTWLLNFIIVGGRYEWNLPALWNALPAIFGDTQGKLKGFGPLKETGSREVSGAVIRSNICKTLCHKNVPCDISIAGHSLEIKKGKPAMRYLRFSPLTFVIAFVLVVGILALAAFAPKNVYGTPSVHTSGGPMRPAPGMTPKSSAAIAFSTQDVQQYALSHPFPGGAVMAGHTIKVQSVTLMTRQQAINQGAELQAYSTTDMVYKVVLEGPFATTYVLAPVPVSPTVSQGYEIFDAHTGDLLEWGTL
ncbi:MAG TPA: hypothetical protein VFU49_20895 [Ktedonobacteraceae bacterium]|nr:hypothetical protein [Ktedonobacteraceae bacterium]